MFGKYLFLGPPGRVGEYGDWGEIGGVGEKGYRVSDNYIALNCSVLIIIIKKLL